MPVEDRKDTIAFIICVNKMSCILKSASIT